MKNNNIPLFGITFGIASRYVEDKSKHPRLHILKARTLILARRSGTLRRTKESTKFTK